MVTCHMIGQLGNQMFQIATTLAYAWDHGAIPIFPELHRNDGYLSYNRDRFFFRLDSRDPPRPFLYSYRESIWHSPDKIPFYPDLYVIGHFQSWKHFHHHRQKILSIFAPAEEEIKVLYANYGKLLNHPNTVAIHVRSFNKEQHESQIHPFLGLEYYEKAIALFPQDALFVIFSDRINWCKKHFKSFPINTIFIEGNDHVRDLYLMSMMKHQIIANSSFSWWAAYLNTNPHKQVVAPQYGMSLPRDSEFLASPQNFYLPDWTLLPVPFTSYPIDITWYDAKSQALDGNLGF